MFVQRVVVPGSRLESWTVVGDDAAPVEPAERYLAFLSDVGRSPNTVKAYAHDLKDWFVFLAGRAADWREVRLEDVGEFVAWQHSARNGVELGDLLRTWQPAGRRGSAWRPFLHHISKGQPAARRAIRMRAVRKHPRVLRPGEVQAILDGCGRLRDRLLFAVLYDTGMRVGEALGLRHEDWAAAEREVAVVPRRNDNGARSKSGAPRKVPVSAGLVRLYADYLHGEYGDCESDYVFVNLWGEPRGHPLSYAAVYDLVRRLRRRTSLDFGPHWFRHAYATRLLRAGTPLEVVSKLLGHASVTTTLTVYGHLSIEDARAVLERAGWFDDGQVRL